MSGPERESALSVTITPGSADLDIGETIQLNAVVRGPSSAILDREVRWSSDDDLVATVSGLGLVEPHRIGTATISAEADGLIGSATITVFETEAVSIAIAPAADTIALGIPKQLEATLRDSTGRELRRRQVAWRSLDPEVATVSPTGLVTGVGRGSASITASHAALLADATISVHFNLASLTAGASHTCGLTDAGVTYCWGSDLSGQLGGGSMSAPELCGGSFGFEGQPCRLTPGPIAVNLEFVTVSAGSGHTCGLTAEGEAHCWGSNAFGQLGDGSTVNKAEPVRVAGSLNFDAIGAGGFHTCALTSQGRTYCWGRNSGGELGDGSGQTRTEPTAVLGELAMASVSVGARHSCGLTFDGDAHCWGKNLAGQLGAGSQGAPDVCDDREGASDFECALSPLRVTGGLNFERISLGFRHSCGLTVGGEAYCWGSNQWGTLGDGTTLDRAAPIAVAGGLIFLSVEAGSSTTCGLTTSGLAHCWGSNSSGELAQGSNLGPELCGVIPCSTLPIPILGDLTFSSLTVAGSHACGPASDGAAYCWGSNSRGELGIGSTEEQAEPVSISGQ